jgi:hypothetical protein
VATDDEIRPPHAGEDGAASELQESDAMACARRTNDFEPSLVVLWMTLTRGHHPDLDPRGKCRDAVGNDLYPAKCRRKVRRDQQDTRSPRHQTLAPAATRD